MTNPGLGEHGTAFLGAGIHVEQRDRGVQLWRHERPQFVSFIARRLSGLDIAAPKPQELCRLVLLAEASALASG
ncbi:MAG TPA: hypothetical protein VGL46_09265 [Pseudonocardiaceae bacterium]